MKKLVMVYAAVGLLLVSVGSVIAAPVNYYLFDDSGGGWADADKTPPDSSDDLLCWAAAASNILEWTGFGNVLGFTDTDQMFGYFKDNWTDKGGLMEYGWDWWFSGNYSGPVVGDTGRLTGSAQPVWSQPDVGTGGFYPELNFDDYFHETWGSSESMSAVDQYLRSGYGTTLAVYSPLRGHAITVWGFEYDVDDPFYYTGVYVTDSDDKTNALKYYEIKNVGLVWYLQGFYGTDYYWHIGGVQAMAPIIIPEPATITMLGIGLIALIKRKTGKK